MNHIHLHLWPMQQTHFTIHFLFIHLFLLIFSFNMLKLWNFPFQNFTNYANLVKCYFTKPILQIFSFNMLKLWKLHYNFWEFKVDWITSKKNYSDNPSENYCNAKTE